jgi:hypothetical protein
MDEKAKPRVAAGLGKRWEPSRWHCLEPEGVTDADDQTHTLWSAL